MFGDFSADFCSICSACALSSSSAASSSSSSSTLPLYTRFSPEFRDVLEKCCQSSRRWLRRRQVPSEKTFHKTGNFRCAIATRWQPCLAYMQTHIHTHTYTHSLQTRTQISTHTRIGYRQVTIDIYAHNMFTLKTHI